MMQPKNRLRELDFLRGIAIILVIFRHQLLFDFLKTMGWIGVDLFFVLSGFLVSGLLFKEYQKFGSINPKLFLIRRGFKIYPIYYLTLLGYMVPRILMHKLDLEKVFYDLVFIQNYVLGWGYLYNPSWSLAVEEHFYFGLALLLWLIFNKKLLAFDMKPTGVSNFEKLLIFSLILVLGLRFASNIYFPEDFVRQVTMTHLRIDSLLFGVLIAYWYNFKQEKLIVLYQSHQSKLLVLAFLMLAFTVAFDDILHAFFVKTIGFSLLYLSFGILLIHFLVNKNVNHQINSLFSTPIVNFVSKIGFCSYSIYVIHSFIITCVDILQIKNTFLSFAIVFSLSILSGFVMTFVIEKFFLNYRDKYFPSRAL
ncbi:acyltransferase family protein [Flavobacterium wongokense]|uniref:acyltransferase family protein n=1 Tax=Flavobacterium wongokense TaxID=2910674 RepID=UPI001F406075|nr:acyltransferase [Flavobacterium sp. WG47]MCF6132669.1 acyltransferase [Flavobacterium sp. WG47]